MPAMICTSWLAPDAGGTWPASAISTPTNNRKKGAKMPIIRPSSRQKCPADSSQDRRNTGTVSATEMAGSRARKRGMATRMTPYTITSSSTPRTAAGRAGPASDSSITAGMINSRISPAKAKKARNSRHSWAPKAKCAIGASLRAPMTSCTTAT